MAFLPCVCRRRGERSEGGLPLAGHNSSAHRASRAHVRISGGGMRRVPVVTGITASVAV